MSSDGSTLLFKAVPSALRFPAADKRLLLQFARTLSTELAHGRAFCCLLTNDKELQRLNRDFLDHDYPTDVLSFPSSGPDGNLGELAVSVERAHAQAQQYGHALSDELKILMLHGVLHLTGLDHERDKGEMARVERKFRTSLGLPLTLLERNRK